MIKGVEIKELVTYSDERGLFRELIRVTDDFFKEGFGQLSHSFVYQGVIKAWHAHKFQGQWNYVVCGLLKVVLYDNRCNSPTFKEKMEFLTGENQTAQVYFFPAGVLHGYKCMHGPMHILYVTSGIYDLNDEVRIPYNDPLIDFDWLKVAPIK